MSRTQTRTADAAEKLRRQLGETAVITEEPVTGCPSGSGPMSIGQLTPPARLLVDRFRGVENVLRQLFAFVLHGIEQQSVVLFENRQN